MAAGSGTKKQKEWKHGYIKDYTIQFVDKQDLLDAFEAAGPRPKSLSPHAPLINRDIRLECDKAKSLDDITTIFRSFGISDMAPSTVCKVMSTVSTIVAADKQRKKDKGSKDTSGSPQEPLLNGILSALIHQLVEDIARVNVGHLASALLQLGKVQYYPSDGSSKYNRWNDVMTLMCHCRPVLFLAETKELGRLIQGLARLVDSSTEKQKIVLDDLAPAGWIDDFCRVSQSKFPKMLPNNLSTIVWGVSTLGHLPSPSWVASFLAQSSLSLSQAEKTDLSYTSWALLQLNQMALKADSSWWEEYQRIHTSHTSTSYEANPLVSIVDDDWANACWEALRVHLEAGDLNPEHLVTIMHSTSLLGHCPPMAKEGAEDKRSIIDLILIFLEGPRGAEMTPKQDSQALSALARWMDISKDRSSNSASLELPPPSPDLLSSITTKHMQARINRYNAKDLHMCLSALAKMNFLPPGPWLGAWSRAARGHLRDFGPEGVSMTFRAFASWQLVPPKDLTKDLMSVSLGLARAKSLTSLEISHILRSARMMNLELGARWPREMIISFSSLASSASHVDIAITCSLLPYLLKSVLSQTNAGDQDKATSGEVSTSWSKLDSSLRQSICSISEAAGSRFSLMDGSQLVGIAKGLSQIDFPAEGEWMSSHAASMSKRIETPEKQMIVLDKAYMRMRRARKARVQKPKREPRDAVEG